MWKLYVTILNRKKISPGLALESHDWIQGKASEGFRERRYYGSYVKGSNSLLAQNVYSSFATLVNKIFIFLKSKFKYAVKSLYFDLSNLGPILFLCH